MKVAKRESAEVLITSNTNSDLDTQNGESTVNEEQQVISSPPVMAAKKEDELLTVRLNRNHSCFIGGTYYVFKKNNVYRIPSDVKRVLSVAGLLAPL